MHEETIVEQTQYWTVGRNELRKCKDMQCCGRETQLAQMEALHSWEYDMGLQAIDVMMLSIWERSHIPWTHELKKQQSVSYTVGWWESMDFVDNWG